MLQKDWVYSSLFCLSLPYLLLQLHFPFVEGLQFLFVDSFKRHSNIVTLMLISIFYLGSIRLTSYRLSLFYRPSCHFSSSLRAPSFRSSSTTLWLYWLLLPCSATETPRKWYPGKASPSFCLTRVWWLSKDESTLAFDELQELLVRVGSRYLSYTFGLFLSKDLFKQVVLLLSLLRLLFLYLLLLFLLWRHFLLLTLALLSTFLSAFFFLLRLPSFFPFFTLFLWLCFFGFLLDFSCCLLNFLKFSRFLFLR